MLLTFERSVLKSIFSRSNSSGVLSHHFNSCNSLIILSSNLLRISLAGLPPTIEYGSTSFVTTEPAQIIAPSPILTPPRIITAWPIHTSFPTVTGLLVLYFDNSPLKSR